MSWPGSLIFLLTYVLISVPRLRWLGFDRPAGALLGAVACVVFGVLSPRQALSAIDGATLLLLFAVMGMGAFLALDGFFEHAERALVRFARTPRRLLGLVVWGAGGLSALITNDAVCVLGAPLLVRLVLRQRLPPAPFLLALATGANTGSVATLVGNPQNMLCGVLGGLAYAEHLLRLAPVAVIGLWINQLLLSSLHGRELQHASLELVPAGEGLPHSARVSLLVIAASVAAYTSGADLAFTAAAAFVALMLIQRRDTRELWSRIDWSLLLFFAGLFVVVAGFQASGVPRALFERYPLGDEGGLASQLRLATIFLVGSNIVSNVPFILVVSPEMDGLTRPELAWELLAMASTFAGNLTLVGSAANIIVAEAAREVGGLGFFQYLRVGLPLALITTLLGSVWLALCFGAL